jgi:hypothetical protein
LIGPTENNGYKIDEQFFNKNYPVVFGDENIKIYRIK